MSDPGHSVTTRDGVRIAFRRYGGGRQAAVIVCPGFFQSKDTPTFQHLSQALAESCDVIAMDFRGHGRSGGRYTFSAQEPADLDAVLGWARARYARLAVIGFSMGGAIAINTLSHSPAQVHGLIAVSAPSTFEAIEFQFWTPEAIRTGLQGWERGAGCRPGNLLLSKERAVDHVSQLAPIPLLFIHGTRDVIVGVDHSRRLYAAASEPKRLEILEGGSHAEALFRDDPDRFVSLINSWLAQTLPPPASA
ncbi:MAG: alpha/beta fold hydrolase [Candidatus Omnitrophica bacterium]|nr:alpha/beta fold hydrolase [Candidatus Omnitrophota bacterium]